MCTPFSLLFTQSKKLPLLRLVTLLLVFLSAFTRTLFFMIDPYATNNVIPPFLEATFFTITYPCLNTSMCLVLLTLYELAQSTKKMTKSSGGFLPSTKKVRGTRRRERERRIKGGDQRDGIQLIRTTKQRERRREQWREQRERKEQDEIHSSIHPSIHILFLAYFQVFFIFSFCQFLTQFTADAIRSFGIGSEILVICQVYFVGWGLLVSVAFGTVGVQVYKLVGQSARAQMWRTFAYVVCSCLFGGILAIFAVIRLTAVGPNQPEAYFALMTIERILEVCLSISMVFAVLPREHADVLSKFTNSVTGSIRNSITVLNSSKGGTTTGGNTSKGNSTGGNSTGGNSTGGNTTMGNNGEDEGEAIVIQKVSTSSVVPYPGKEATSTAVITVSAGIEEKIM